MYQQRSSPRHPCRQSSPEITADDSTEIRPFWQKKWMKTGAEIAHKRRHEPHFIDDPEQPVQECTFL